MLGWGVPMPCALWWKSLDLRTAVAAQGQAFVLPRYGYEYGIGVVGFSWGQWNLLDR